MPAAVNARLRQDTIEFVQSPAYLPVSIPKLRTVPVWFQETADEGGPSSAIALVRNEYKQKGLGVLQIIVFLLVLPSLGGKPLPYSQSVQNVAKHHDVLKAVVERIDERLVKQVPRVDGGLAMFIALQWEECECDTAFARQWLDPILRPIIEFAGKSYLCEKSPAISILDETENNFTVALILFPPSLSRLLRRGFREKSHRLLAVIYVF
ncbi:hypothetical protein C8R43DRAFT_498877 [Mycena crocata]|nr:hypothetical protein C8R43DRAFT_498877 [Mycena crocata]